MTEKIRLLQFTRSFYLGGTEGQVLELLRLLPARDQVSLAVIERKGPMMEQVRALGFEPPDFPLRGSVLRPNTAWQVLRLARWIRAQRVQLVSPANVSKFCRGGATSAAAPPARNERSAGRRPAKRKQPRPKPAGGPSRLRESGPPAGVREADRPPIPPSAAISC